jgi:hypothetical protein
MGMSQMGMQQPMQQSGGKGGIASTPQTPQSGPPKSINDLYQQVLGRDAEPEGMNHWTQRFGDTIDPNEIEEFKQAAQPELQNRTTQAPQGQPMGQPSGKGGSTNSATSGQPRMAQPNMYSNTAMGWDNASIQPTQSRSSGGKGKGS